MKKTFFILFFSFCILQLSFSQNPLSKKWDKRFGGTLHDRLHSLIETSDKGFLLGGGSDSPISGDKTQPNWGTGFDFWILKTDSAGIKLWDKRYGGTDGDDLYAMEQTADNGYILAGISNSEISGDKTQPDWDTVCSFYSYCKPDYWMVKIDSIGNKQWDKRFGGTNEEDLLAVHQTKDGGYILGGWSWSGINGDKTQLNCGTLDFWIVKTDSTGNKQWDKCFGGPDADYLNTLILTTDGGYLLGGPSFSDIGCDKTEYNRDTAIASWSSDYWIIKIDSLGNKQWDKTFGGTDWDELYSLQQTKDGGFILGGISRSDSSGDKTQNKWDPYWFHHDYWIVKTDSLGNKEWDKDFGAIGDEYSFGNIFQTSDVGYLISGTSNSYISGDKTEDNLGNLQAWIIKTDSLGVKQWDKTIFTKGDDDFRCIAIQTHDGCYAIANPTWAGVGGYKTQPNWFPTTNVYLDYWFVKFCECTLNELPNAAFTSDKKGTCAQECINFLDYSDCYTSRQWLFPGGVPSSSTEQNPVVCYPDSGYYSATLISTNAYGSDTLTQNNYIHIKPLPQLPVITFSNDTLFAYSADATLYQWHDSASVVSPYDSVNYYVPSHEGYYYVCVKNIYTYRICSDSVYINLTGISELTSSTVLKISPNPFTDKISITLQKQNLKQATISIKNILGQTVFEKDFSSEGKSPSGGFRGLLDLSFLSKGVYLLEVVNDGQRVIRKIVKE